MSNCSEGGILINIDMIKFRKEVEFHCRLRLPTAFGKEYFPGRLSKFGSDNVRLVHLFFELDSVDSLAERIDSSIQQAVNPALEQLSNKAHNVRESLGIWNRPFSPISSGHPNPVAAPNTNIPTQNEGTFTFNEKYLALSS